MRTAQLLRHRVLRGDFTVCESYGGADSSYFCTSTLPSGADKYFDAQVLPSGALALSVVAPAKHCGKNQTEVQIKSLPTAPCQSKATVSVILTATKDILAKVSVTVMRPTSTKATLKSSEGWFPGGTSLWQILFVSGDSKNASPNFDGLKIAEIYTPVPTKKDCGIRVSTEPAKGVVPVIGPTQYPHNSVKDNNSSPSPEELIKNFEDCESVAKQSWHIGDADCFTAPVTTFLRTNTCYKFHRALSVICLGILLGTSGCSGCAHPNTRSCRKLKKTDPVILVIANKCAAKAHDMSLYRLSDISEEDDHWFVSYEPKRPKMTLGENVAVEIDRNNCKAELVPQM